MGKTRIQVSEETRDRLKQIGDKGQSYDDVISDVLAERKFFKALNSFKNKMDDIQKLREAGVGSVSGNISKYFNDDGEVKEKYKEVEE